MKIETAMKGWKAFDADMKCRGKQYETGQSYEEPEARLCETGIHFCEMPMAVLSYYPVIGQDGRPTRYAEVEAPEGAETDESQHKYVTKKLTVGAEIGVPGLIKAQIEYVRNRAEEKAASGEMGNAAASGEMGNAAASGVRGNAAASGWSGNAAASGWSGNAAASGERGNAAASGARGNATASGVRGNAAASGEMGNAAASGVSGNAAASGERGNAAASGWSGNAAASGERGNAAASGVRGNATASGERGTAVVTGKEGRATAAGAQCLAVAWGERSKAKGSVGSWLVLTEYDGANIKDAKLVKVDGETVKADTFYRLSGGKIEEANDAED